MGRIARTAFFAIIGSSLIIPLSGLFAQESVAASKNANPLTQKSVFLPARP